MKSCSSPPPPEKNKRKKNRVSVLADLRLPFLQSPWNCKLMFSAASVGEGAEVQPRVGFRAVIGDYFVQPPSGAKKAGAVHVPLPRGLR